jgi:hypothetical protein
MFEGKLNLIEDRPSNIWGSMGYYICFDVKEVLRIGMPLGDISSSVAKCFRERMRAEQDYSA